MPDDGAVTTPAPRRRGLRALRGRYRRRPLLAGVLTVGVVGGVVVFALDARPDVEATVRVPLGEAYAGTTYAFDGVLCLSSPRVSAELGEVEVEQAEGSTTRVVLPPEGARPALGFPAPDEGEPVEGYRVVPGEADCTLRVLVTPEAEGAVQAGVVRVPLRYGPFGLLRRTAEVRPQVTLDVTATGEDPRGALDAG